MLAATLAPYICYRNSCKVRDMDEECMLMSIIRIKRNVAFVGKMIWVLTKLKVLLCKTYSMVT